MDFEVDGGAQTENSQDHGGLGILIFRDPVGRPPSGEHVRGCRIRLDIAAEPQGGTAQLRLVARL
jgi:hypothetical protein